MIYSASFTEILRKVRRTYARKSRPQRIKKTRNWQICAQWSETVHSRPLQEATYASTLKLNRGYSTRGIFLRGVGRYYLPVCLNHLILIGSHKTLILLQILGERGPFCKSTVKVGLKSVLDTKTCSWDMQNQTALSYIKYHPPT